MVTQELYQTLERCTGSGLSDLDAAAQPSFSHASNAQANACQASSLAAMSFLQKKDEHDPNLTKTGAVLHAFKQGLNTFRVELFLVGKRTYPASFRTVL